MKIRNFKNKMNILYTCSLSEAGEIIRVQTDGRTIVENDTQSCLFLTTKKKAKTNFVKWREKWSTFVITRTWKFVEQCRLMATHCEYHGGRRMHQMHHNVFKIDFDERRIRLFRNWKCFCHNRHQVEADLHCSFGKLFGKFKPSMLLWMSFMEVSGWINRLNLFWSWIVAFVLIY